MAVGSNGVRERSNSQKSRAHMLILLLSTYLLHIPYWYRVVNLVSSQNMITHAINKKEKAHTLCLIIPTHHPIFRAQSSQLFFFFDRKSF
jgi:hypothetical protein